MVKWVPTFVMVLAIMSPLPLFMTPTPAEVDVNLDWVGWEAPLLSRGSPGDVIYVVDISDVPDGERITYISLQGLVNRKAGEIYLIHNEKDLFWLEQLRSTYNVTTRWLAPGAFIERYRDVPRGLVVIDPAKEATVNLATTIAGVERFLIVHPSRVDRFREILGKDLWALDLRDPPWGDLEGMHLYRKAFEAYFARCSQRFIAFLPPDVHYARDLAVSQAAFTLYQVPGPFSNPLEWEGLKTVLRDTPYTHAILGSIEPYIGAEEDFAIREFSIHGKYFVPVARVPNLSILSTFEPTRDLDVGRSAPDVSVEPRHYVCIGVEDGDNLAFLQDRMVDLWLRPDRETVPMAWTLPPYARDLAPLFVDYYLSSTPGYDTFFMAPSGSGLAFPDFMPDGARDRFMDLTREHALEMNASFAWVLNSYRTYEVRYTEDLLERYVDIGLRGLVLDYDDMPWHEQYRIVGARERHAPVIRSTQLWRDIDNLRAKLEVHRDAYDERPLFTFLAYNPWSGDLDDLVDLLDDLGCEVVDIATFFALMERASIGDARRTVDTLRSIPTSALVPMFADGADDLLDDATANGTSNAYLAWRARQRAEAGIGVALAVLVLVMAGAAAVLLLVHRHRSGIGPPAGAPAIRVATLTLILTGFLLLYYRIQFSETWNYFPLTAAIFLTPVAGALALGRDRGQLLRAGVLLHLGGLFGTYLTWWAFPLHAIGVVLLIEWTAAGHMDEVVLALSFALALALLLPREWAMAAALGLVVPALLLATASLRHEERTEGHGSFLGPILLALLVLGGLIPDSRYMNYRFDLLPTALHTVSVVILPSAGIVGMLVMGTPVRRHGFWVGLALFGISWALVPRTDALTALTGLLLTQQIGIVLMAINASRRGTRVLTPLFPAVMLSLLMFLNMAFYTTPVIADVYIFPLTYGMNYVLYHHALFFAILAAVLLAARLTETFLHGRGFPGRVAPGLRRRATRGG